MADRPKIRKSVARPRATRRPQEHPIVKPVGIPLLHLEPQFVRREVRIEQVTRLKPEIAAVKREGPYVETDWYTGDGEVTHHVHVMTLDEADGIYFHCPKCHAAGGSHLVLCWFEGKVPDDASPGPGRWKPTGTGYHDLSFVAHTKSNSVLLTSGCKWHGFITNGIATSV